MWGGLNEKRNGGGDGEENSGEGGGGGGGGGGGADLDGNLLAAGAVVANGANEVLWGGGVEREAVGAHRLHRGDAEAVGGAAVVVPLFRHLRHRVCSIPIPVECCTHVPIQLILYFIFLIKIN